MLLRERLALVSPYGLAISSKQLLSLRYQGISDHLQERSWNAFPPDLPGIFRPDPIILIPKIQPSQIGQHVTSGTIRGSS